MTRTEFRLYALVVSLIAVALMVHLWGIRDCAESGEHCLAILVDTP